MPLQEDCPICKVIVSGNIEAKGDRCYLIQIGSVKIAVLKEHSSSADGVALGEAAKLLNYQGSSGFLADYSEVPAHWGLRIIPTTDLPSGGSRGRSS